MCTHDPNFLLFVVRSQTHAFLSIITGTYIFSFNNETESLTSQFSGVFSGVTFSGVFFVLYARGRAAHVDASTLPRVATHYVARDKFEYFIARHRIAQRDALV